MVKRTVHNGLDSEEAKKYPWYERQRCCDQEYELEWDNWSLEDLQELRADLESNEPFPCEVDLYFDNRKCGELTIDLLEVFRVAKEIVARKHWEKGPREDANRSREAPLTSSKVDQAVVIVAGIYTECLYQTDLVDLMHSEAQIVPTINRGPDGLIDVLAGMWGVEGLRSRRTLRAMHAVAHANTFQKGFKNEPQSSCRREVEREQPHRLQRMGITTLALTRQFRSLLDAPLREHRKVLSHRPSGRPRKVDPIVVRSRFQEARALLAQFHRRIKKAHSPVSRRATLGDYPELNSRLAASGLGERLVAGHCPSLEVLVCELLASELGISPQTVRRYARTAGKSKSRKHSFTHEKTSR